MKRPQKFETITHFIWHLLSKGQIKWEIVLKFVTFLETWTLLKKSCGQKLDTDLCTSMISVFFCSYVNLANTNADHISFEEKDCTLLFYQIEP